MQSFVQDLRFAIRQLERTPGFALTAILILALGIGVSVAIFGFVDAALIKPLPYRDPTRLVGVFESDQMGPRFELSYLDYLDWKSLNKVFSSIGAYQGNVFILSAPTGAQEANGARVSDGFFRTLGVTAVLGRNFQPGEDLPASPHTVMLSYAAWQKRFGGSRDVMGQTITLDGTLHTVIGVLPRDFHFAPAGPVEFWTTLHASGGCDMRRGCHNLFGIARLKDGVSLQSASANMTSIANQLEQQYPTSNRGQGATVLPLTTVIVGDVRPILLVLLSGADLLLLIACINVSSLLLARSDSRKREIAVRGALGAAPARLIRQFATEGLVLVVGGGLLGLISARWVMQLLTKLIPSDMMDGMPYLQGLGLNFHVAAFACAIALIAAALFAIAPILRVSLSNLRDGLTEGSRGSTGTMWRRFGSNLVVVELAIAMVLLVGAGLLGKSLYRLLNVDIGIKPDHLATLQVVALDPSYSTPERAVALERKVLGRIATLPGVKAVGIANQLPVNNNGNTVWFRVVGRPYRGEHDEVATRQVGSGYFATLQAQLLRGRYFSEDEDASKPLVTIINQAMAKQYFAGEDPIGKQILYASLSHPPMQIVGIVDNIKEGPLDTATGPAMYVPFNQDAASYFSVVVRTSQDERSFLPTLAAAIHQIDPGIVTADEATMSEIINNSPSAYLHRSSAWLVGSFAIIAFLLSVVGLYGVVAYSVSQRTREIGIRMALGAHRGSVYHLILKETTWLTAMGIGLGLTGSMATARLMRGLLFGVRPWDMPTLLVVAAVLAASALLASYIPARRAAKVDPMVALRYE